MEPVFHEFQRDFGEIVINLDQCDGQEFIAALLDSEPNQLSHAFRELLFQHTTGHPLFTIELLRSMQDGGELMRDDTGKWIARKTVSWDRLPQRVEAVIAERVGRLPRELRHILEAASVEGNEFTAEVVASVLKLDEGLLVRQLSEQLEHKHHLVTATQFRRMGDQRISGYRFQNQLFQKYLYDSLDNIEQAYLHDAVAQTIERFYQPYPEEREVFALSLARHFEKAGMLQKAISYLQIAGKRAERLSACNEAIVIYRHALELCSELTDTSEHLQTEIVLSKALGAQLVALGGYTSVELEQVYTRAQQLCQDLAQQLDEPRLAASLLIPVLLEFGGYHGHRAQYQAAREIYDQILALAQAAGDPQLMMLANWGPGYLLFSVGEFLSAQSHLEEALDAYEVYKHQEQTTIFTINLGVSCLGWLSCTSFLLGFPDQALSQSRQAIALARKIGHPYSLAVALAVATLLQSLMLDAKRTQALAEEAIAICREKGFLYWLSVSIAYRGLALAWQEEYEAGISQMKEGEAIWRASGAYIGMAEYLITLGEVLGNSGQVDEGLRVLEEAFEMIQQSGEEVYASELYRTKALLLLKLSNENQAEAEACFHEAIKIAKNQQAKILELRATTSLCGLLVKQGRKEEARKMLAAIYGWFTEGFETQDLILASNQLAELE